MDQPIITQTQIAEYFGVTRRTIYNYLQEFLEERGKEEWKNHYVDDTLDFVIWYEWNRG